MNNSAALDREGVIYNQGSGNNMEFIIHECWGQVVHCHCMSRLLVCYHLIMLMIHATQELGPLSNLIFGEVATSLHCPGGLSVREATQTS